MAVYEILYLRGVEMITLSIQILKDAIELTESQVLLGIYKNFDYEIRRRGDEIDIADRNETDITITKEE